MNHPLFPSVHRPPFVRRERNTCRAASRRHARPAAARTKQDVEGIIRAMNRLLLVVEDDPSLREVIRLGLEMKGFRVLTAADGPSALIDFASHKPDLMLLDVMLPLLDGFAVCREIRRVSLVPVIMLTARTSTTDVVQGLEAGADDYVTKPFEFPELVARVRSVLRRASFRGGAPADSGVTSGRADLERDPPAGTISSATALTTPCVILGPLTIDPGAYMYAGGMTRFRLP